MKYSIVILPVARKEMLDLPCEVQKRVDKKILALADDPRPNNAKALQGEKGIYRIRVGDFRIVYSVEDRIVTVIIVRVRHRKDVYRK